MLLKQIRIIKDDVFQRIILEHYDPIYRFYCERCKYLVNNECINAYYFSKCIKDIKERSNEYKIKIKVSYNVTS